jgi:hypothetical protein
MSVEIYATESALTVECRDILTIEDARYILDHCLEAVRAQPQHFLIDCTHMHSLAPGVLNVLAGYTTFLLHPNTRCLAFVTENNLLITSIRLLFHASMLRIFASREAAWRFLGEIGT